MKQILKDLFEEYEINASENQLEKLAEFYNIVIEENKKFNLTAITDINDFAIKHILDSILPEKHIPNGARVIDIGAGAGFPSIPLKIIREDLDITMLDSLQKRVNFLNDTVRKLELKKAVAYHDRAEDYIKGNKERFDIAIARAVANLNTLSEYCLPYVKVGGLFIAMKGASFEEEIKQAQNAIAMLGGRIQNIDEKLLPGEVGKRVSICIKKEYATPFKYPRGKNQPRLNPLQ